MLLRPHPEQGYSNMIKYSLNSIVSVRITAAADFIEEGSTST